VGGAKMARGSTRGNADSADDHKCHIAADRNDVCLAPNKASANSSAGRV
jgi:hypothetical protein